jgi:hypothetical protein
MSYTTNGDISKAVTHVDQAIKSMTAAPASPAPASPPPPGAGPAKGGPGKGGPAS